MSYITENISLIRANIDIDNFSSGEIKDIESKAYANLLFPYILDNGGNTNIISLTIDILDSYAENSNNFNNSTWINNKRIAGNLIQDNTRWGFVQTVHSKKKTRGMSNAYCFNGQELTFYIAPQGHLTGYIDDKWIYCKTNLTIQSVNLATGETNTIYSFSGFEKDILDSSRYFTWQVPEKDNNLFSQHGFFGIYLIVLEVESTYYEDGELRKPLSGYYPNISQTYLQLMTYNGAKELLDVGSGTYSLLTGTITDDTLLKDIFQQTIFQNISLLNQNSLTEEQKRAIVSDQIATIFMSQHPVVTADYYPGTIVGFGAEESIKPRKVIQQAINYSKRYREITDLAKDRLFGTLATYKSFNFASEFENIFSGYIGSNQKIIDPSRIILINSDGIVSNDLGIEGVLFNPYNISSANAQIMFNIPVQTEHLISLQDNSITTNNFKIKLVEETPNTYGSNKVQLSFDVIAGEELINRIRYTIWTKNNLNQFEYIDSIGVSRSHIFTTQEYGSVIYSIPSYGDVIYGRLDIEDVYGFVNVFFAETFIPSDDKVPGVINFQAVQRDDGSGLVDVYYDYFGYSEINSSKLDLYYSVDSGFTWKSVSSSSVIGDFGVAVSPGHRKFSWNPAIDLSTDSFGEYPKSILLKMQLFDADLVENVGEGRYESKSVVLSLNIPKISLRRIYVEEEEQMFESSTSSVSSSSSSSSSSIGYSSSSSSSIDSSSSSSSSIDSSSSSSSSYEIIYRITGDGNGPDGSPNGDYTVAGVYAGENYYTSLTTPFYISLQEPIGWMIALDLMVLPAMWWKYTGSPASALGTYIPNTTYTGTPTFQIV